MNTPTPRTDAAVIDNAHFSDQGHGDSPYVYADFARTLETECSTLRAALEGLMLHSDHMMHQGTCAKWTRAFAMCSCGLDGALVAARNAATAASGAALGLGGK